MLKLNYLSLLMKHISKDSSYMSEQTSLLRFCLSTRNDRDPVLVLVRVLRRYIRGAYAGHTLLDNGRHANPPPVDQMPHVGLSSELTAVQLDIFG